VKERNGRGQFRATETLAYKKKLKNHFGQFDNVSQEAYMEAATEKYDFSTCQRPDGSKYGSPGRCVKGTETSPASKDDKKSGSKSASGGGGSASSSSGGGPTKADISTKRKEVREMDKVAKAADKSADKADKKFQKSKSPADQKEARRLDKVAKSANKEADKADRELKRMTKSSSNEKKRQSNVNVNKALESGNKTQLRKAQSDIGGKIAKLEAAGKPVPKSLRATSKLLRERMES
jgi:hypothetical protein